MYLIKSQNYNIISVKEKIMVLYYLVIIKKLMTVKADFYILCLQVMVFNIK